MGSPRTAVSSTPISPAAPTAAAAACSKYVQNFTKSNPVSYLNQMSPIVII